jgi:undecaprenyl-diphosphatase
MTILQALILGIVQGATEFLPVSSSGHLVLAEEFFGLKVENLLSFDVVVHAGTLLALVIYFRKDLQIILNDITKISRSFSINFHNNFATAKNSLLTKLIIATLPVVIAGPLLKDTLETHFRSSGIVIWMLLITALFLTIAELRTHKIKQNTISPLSRGDVTKRESGGGNRGVGGTPTNIKSLMIGTAQILALIPGISRSGTTIAAGMSLGLDRETAAKFGFLMAIPAISGATILILKDYQIMIQEGLNLSVLAIGFISSSIVSYLCIKWMLNWVKQRSLWIFVSYLVIISTLLHLF